MSRQPYEFTLRVWPGMSVLGIARPCIQAMDEEVTPILSAVPGVDLTQYKKTLIERFANPAIRDQLSRIGIYGSSRIPKFVLPSIEEQLMRGGPIKLLSFTVASWFRNSAHPMGEAVLLKNGAARHREVEVTVRIDEPGMRIESARSSTSSMGGAPRGNTGLL